jgi:hypothetical protein
MPYISVTSPALFIAHTVRSCYRTQIRSIKTFNNQLIDTEKQGNLGILNKTPTAWDNNEYNHSVKHNLIHLELMVYPALSN